MSSAALSGLGLDVCVQLGEMDKTMSSSSPCSSTIQSPDAHGDPLIGDGRAVLQELVATGGQTAFEIES